MELKDNNNPTKKIEFLCELAREWLFTLGKIAKQNIANV